MELIVDRKWKKPNYTISNLTINGKWFCNVIEDTDRGLKDTMTLEVDDYFMSTIYSVVKLLDKKI